MYYPIATILQNINKWTFTCTYLQGIDGFFIYGGPSGMLSEQYILGNKEFK